MFGYGVVVDEEDMVAVAGWWVENWGGEGKCWFIYALFCTVASSPSPVSIYASRVQCNVSKSANGQVQRG